MAASWVKGACANSSASSSFEPPRLRSFPAVCCVWSCRACFERGSRCLNAGLIFERVAECLAFEVLEIAGMSPDVKGCFVNGATGSQALGLTVGVESYRAAVVQVEEVVVWGRSVRFKRDLLFGYLARLMHFGGGVEVLWERRPGRGELVPVDHGDRLFGCGSPREYGNVDG